MNGWTFAPVGSHLLNYDSLGTLTYFKGHVQGGFCGSDKNLGIGCADTPIALDDAVRDLRPFRS